MTAGSLAVAATLAVALHATLARSSHRRLVAGRLAALGDAAARRRPDPFLRLGAPLVRLAGRLVAASPSAGVDDAHARLAGAALVVLAAAGASPVLGAAAAGTAVVVTVRARRRPVPPGASAAEAVDGLPDTVDLLAVVARAGLPAPAAVAAVAPRAPPPWHDALGAVARRVTRGERFVDALDELVATCGEPASALRAVLRSATEDGAHLPAGLERLAADARDLRRRRAEEQARKVPVRLLLPLVACSLPAFALLTIVPILVAALGELDL